MNKFYLHYKEAVAMKEVAAIKLIGRIWQPYNCNVVDILIKPNENPTYHILVIFEDDRWTTLYDFLEANNLKITDFTG